MKLPRQVLPRIVLFTGAALSALVFIDWMCSGDSTPRSPLGEGTDSKFASQSAKVIRKGSYSNRLIHEKSPCLLQHEDALEMTLFTLRKMAEGGIHDHLGGGFHRYSVDAYWHVPHFEKMLYDQAQLAGSYLEACPITREPFYADVVRDILDYVLRDMTGRDGQFDSAEDAGSPLPANPSERAEGAFYVWEWQEIVDAPGSADAEVFNFHYDVKQDGNAPGDPNGEFKNKNILIVGHTVEDTAKKFGKTPADIRALLTRARAMLHEVNSRFIPSKILLLADGGAGQKVLAGYLEFIKRVQMLGGQATAYVCENSACKLPTRDIAKLAALITPLKNEERKSPLKNINIRSQR